VFLDIQMPGRSGFELLERVGGDFKTVFVTAYDAHAIRAFEVNALDYLLKPVSPERLSRALERAAGAGAADAGAPAAARRLEYADPVFVVADGRPRLLKVTAVACIAGAGDYSEVHTSDGRKHFVLKGLKEWEERLPEQHFARIHRSTIVNLEYVEELEEWFNRSYRVAVRGMPEPLVMSRRYAARLRERFG
jgi:two-component system, LytTR family, response regulator